MQASIGVDVSLGSLPMTTVLSASNPNGLASRLLPLEASQEEQANLLETPPSGVGARRLAGGVLELHTTPKPGRQQLPDSSPSVCAPAAMQAPRSANILHNHSASRKKPHLQGRFSGRLETKDDEKKLHDECRLLGPLLGGVGKRGEKSRTTLAKIVRAISAGDVRKYCEERESRNQEIEERMKALEVYYQREISLLKQENAALRMKLDIRGEEMVHRQVPSAHFSQEPLGSYGMDASTLPYLLPTGTNPSAPVLQSQVSGALHSVPLQQAHAHLSIPSLPHHTMVGTMQGGIIQDPMQATKSMIQDDVQTRSQMFHQARDAILADASHKRKRDEYSKVTHGGANIATMKPEVLSDDAPELDGSSRSGEKSEKLTKHYRMTDQQKNSSGEVVEGISVQGTGGSDLKTSESSAFTGGRIHTPTSLPHQILPPNGGEKGCVGFGSDKNSMAYQNQKMGPRLESGMYQPPVHQRNASAGNGLSQHWIHQAAALGTHYFVPEPDRYFHHISKEPLQQHGNMLMGHAHGVQHNTASSVHDPTANVARPLNVDNHTSRVLDTQNGNDLQLSPGGMSLLHHSRRQAPGSHSTVPPPHTGISTDSGHQL